MLLTFSLCMETSRIHKKEVLSCRVQVADLVALNYHMQVIHIRLSADLVSQVCHYLKPVSDNNNVLLFALRYSTQP